MSKIVLSLLIFVLPAFSAISWDSQHVFHLSKDEWGRVVFHEKGKNPKRFTYEFRFRWTLYDGKKVILLSNYRDFPKQHVLYFESKLNSMRQILLSDVSKNTQKKTYLLLSMDEFDKKNSEITFLIFIKDNDKRFDIKYIDPKIKGVK